MPVVIAMGGGPGLPSWGDFDFRMLLHGEQGVTVHGPIPRRRRGRGDHARSSASTTRARPRSSASRTSRRTSTAASPRSRRASRRSSAAKAVSARPRARDRRPAEDAGQGARPRGDVRDARRPGAALPPQRRPQPAALRPGDRQVRAASTSRSCTASARTASPAGRCCTSCAAPTSAKFKSMDARFSKPVMPGDTLTVKMWDDGAGRRDLPDRQPGRHRRHRRRRLHLR